MIIKLIFQNSADLLRNSAQFNVNVDEVSDFFRFFEASLVYVFLEGFKAHAIDLGWIIWGMKMAECKDRSV